MKGGESTLEPAVAFHPGICYPVDMQTRLQSASPALDRETGNALIEEVRLAASLPVADAAVQVLHLLLIESLTARRREWTERTTSAGVVQVGEIRMMIRPGLRRLMRSAADSARERGVTEILAVDIARALSAQWCRIWPFCPSAKLADDRANT